MQAEIITPVAEQHSSDGSKKFLWQFSDGLTVECVRFTFHSQEYVCVSSQIGCNVGCAFCATGQQRSLRNLTVEEIYQQVAYTVKQDRQSVGMHQLYQVAIAGMGEPLLNFSNVTQAAARLRSDGLTETVSVSTSGIVPRIRELATTAAVGVNKLFISLHATRDDIRKTLIPITEKYPIAAVLEAARAYYEHVGVKVTATYLMFEHINDSDGDLERLLMLLDPQIFIVQLSEWNAIPGVTFVSSPRIEHFHEQLAYSGFEVFIQRSKGQDIEGGCGQLRSRFLPVIQGNTPAIS